jgi:hypothetical protein
VTRINADYPPNIYKGITIDATSFLRDHLAPMARELPPHLLAGAAVRSPRAYIDPPCTRYPRHGDPIPVHAHTCLVGPPVSPGERSGQGRAGSLAGL